MAANRMALLMTDIAIVGASLAARRWQIALVGTSLIGRQWSVKELFAYDPLDNEAAATLAATLIGRRDVPAFVAEQRLITERLLARVDELQSQRRQLRQST
jgi:hypothetical protein